MSILTIICSHSYFENYSKHVYYVYSENLCISLGSCVFFSPWGVSQVTRRLPTCAASVPVLGIRLKGERIQPYSSTNLLMHGVWYCCSHTKEMSCYNWKYVGRRGITSSRTDFIGTSILLIWRWAQHVSGRRVATNARMIQSFSFIPTHWVRFLRRNPKLDDRCTSFAYAVKLLCSETIFFFAACG